MERKETLERLMACSKECVVIAAIGGLLPTAAKLASTFTTAPDTPLPGWGMAIGLALFALIGAVLAYALSESNVRQALILGVAAPGIITNLVAGAQDFKMAQLDVGSVVASALVGTAHAQPMPTATSQQRKVIVNTALQNADAWSAANLRVGVKFLRSDGQPIGTTASFFASSGAALTVPEGAARAVFTAGGKSVPIDLTASSTTGVNLNASISGKNDLAWAFGARRQPTLSELMVGPPPPSR